MNKNTVLFILLLGALAVGTGYSKYVLIPRYQAQHPVSSPVVSPIPSLAPVADATQTATNSGFLAQNLTSRAKLLQFVSLTLPVPIATTSASTKLILENNPGFVTLTGQYAATASAQKAIKYVNEHLLTQPSIPVLFAVKPAGKMPELCALDDKCLKLIPKESLYSDPIEMASSPATLEKLALNQFQEGKVVLNLSANTTQATLDYLLKDLAQVYETNPVFKKTIDDNLEAILKIKQELQ